MYFYAAGSGTTPGALLGYYSLSSTVLASDTYNELSVTTTGTPITLTGSSFWMAVSETGTRTAVKNSGLGEFSGPTVGSNPTTTWFDGTAVASPVSNPAGNLAAYGGGTGDGLGFIVDVAAVPAPEAASVTGLGIGVLALAGLFAFGRRKSAANSLT